MIIVTHPELDYSRFNTKDTVTYLICHTYDDHKIEELLSREYDHASTKHDTTVSFNFQPFSLENLETIFEPYTGIDTLCKIGKYIRRYLGSFSIYKVQIKRKAIRKDNVSIDDSSRYLNLPEVKRLLDLGFEFVSSKIQLKNGTLMFKFPVYLVKYTDPLDQEHLNKVIKNSSGITGLLPTYLFNYSITKPGFLRLDDGHVPAKNLSSAGLLNSPEEYNSALEQGWIKLQKYFAKRGMIIEPMTPEQRQSAKVNHHIENTLNDLW